MMQRPTVILRFRTLLISAGTRAASLFLLGLAACGPALPDGIGGGDGVHGLPTTIPNDRTFTGSLTFKGQTALEPSSDSIPLLIRGSSSSATSPLVQVSPYSGAANTFYIDSLGRGLFKAQDDTYVPLTIYGHSATQSANLLNLWPCSTGCTEVAEIAANGTASFINPADGNKSIQLNGGTNINFHTDGGAGSFIQASDTAKPITFKTSTSTGGYDITNLILTTTGNEVGVATQFDAAVTSTLSCAAGFTRVDLKSCLRSDQISASNTLSSGVCKTVTAPDAGATAETIAGYMGVNTTGTATLIFYSDSTCTTSMAQDIAGQNSSAVMSIPFRRHLVLPSAGATISMKNSNGGGTYWVTQYND